MNKTQYQNEIAKNLGQRLKAERERLDLTQQELGNVVNVSQRTIIAWENGDTFPNALQLILLSDIGLNTTTLLSTSTTKCNERLNYNDINFSKRTGSYVLSAIDEINKFFDQHPEYKLINTETKYAVTGEPVGLRYFYLVRGIASPQLR